jgi:hypothetical protein
MDEKEKVSLYLVARVALTLVLAAVLEANGIDSSFLLGLIK